MQTFLPYSSFVESARCLDNKRLGKQRVEVLQILNTLTGKSKGWTNHPTVKMWKGYELALVLYGIVVCVEWKSRGFKDTCLIKIMEIVKELDMINASDSMPPFYGDKDFHKDHRKKLFLKNPEYYSRFKVELKN